MASVRNAPTSVQGKFYAAGNRSRLGNPSGTAVGRGRVATFQPTRGR